VQFGVFRRIKSTEIGALFQRQFLPYRDHTFVHVASGMTLNPKLEFHIGLGFNKFANTGNPNTHLTFSSLVNLQKDIFLTTHFAWTQKQTYQHFTWISHEFRTAILWHLDQNISFASECFLRAQNLQITILGQLKSRSINHKVSVGVLPVHAGWTLTKRLKNISIDVEVALHQALGPSPALSLIFL